MRKLLNIDEKQTIIIPEDAPNLTTEMHVTKDDTIEEINNHDSSNNKLTTLEKITLFRRLFRGRDDMLYDGKIRRGRRAIHLLVPMNGIVAYAESQKSNVVSANKEKRFYRKF